MLQFASVCFDASVWEIATALSQGATLCLAAKADLFPGAPLMATLARHAVSHTLLPPSALRVLPLDELSEHLTVVVGGEACPPDLARQVAARNRLFNAYGPTEATICATLYRVGTEIGASVPIGRPVANTRIYILDAHGEPAPVGVAGELHVGGVQVARDYLNRPELTAERFVSDPFSGQPDARMYKTGDLGRWLPDGNIEYLGRNDFQVKIRGFRIELGEIEARLAACAGVREALVLAREDSPGDKRLVAYYVGAEGTAPEDLRGQLAAGLPDYMLPSAFVRLDAFPLTPNGKLDRKALSAPGQDALIARPYEAPVGDIETAVATIWQALLRVERVGRFDNFFELGGHSLLAMQLVTRIQQQLKIEISVLPVFSCPNLALLAEALLAVQVETYLETDMETLQLELDSMSEEELRAMLENDG
jgi:acyl-coenzyme A synthetase/AMP-(fatty) acid ligase/acyl carrier protein